MLELSSSVRGKDVATRLCSRAAKKNYEDRYEEDKARVGGKNLRQPFKEKTRQAAVADFHYMNKTAWQIAMQIFSMCVATFSPELHKQIVEYLSAEDLAGTFEKAEQEMKTEADAAEDTGHLRAKGFVVFNIFDWKAMLSGHHR